MKEHDAREVLGMAKAATTQFALDDDTVNYWMHALSPLDAAIATKAVLLGAKTWPRFPSWAQFYDAYLAIKSELKREERQVETAKEGRYGYAPPEWTLVWNWARNYRDPKDERGFPQMQDWADPENTMTTSDYEALRAEWVAAGSPKENPLADVRVGAGRWV